MLDSTVGTEGFRVILLYLTTGDRNSVCNL